MLLKEYVGLLKESALDLEVFLRDRKMAYSHDHAQHG